jgi:lysophospholipase L1-like esterase
VTVAVIVACSLLFAVVLAGCGGAGAAVPQQRIAVIGDSITAGYMPHDGVTLQLRQGLSYTADLAQAGEVVTAAVGGASTADALATQAHWLAGVDFDTLVILLGTNDAVLGRDRAQALRNVTAIADRWPRARLVLVAPPRWAAAADAWLDPWSADLRMLAGQRGARFVDLFGASRPEWLCHPTDRHPCAAAHREMGAMVVAAVK